MIMNKTEKISNGADKKPLGKVTHYYDKAMVAIVKLSGRGLKVGDAIKFVKGENEFTQNIESMQIEHEALKSAKKGQEVAVKTDQPTKEGALVYKAE
jgi:translation initiation factor IF-2